jgi:MerR family transcriptional regulator, light-induced transcriptional regulator
MNAIQVAPDSSVSIAVAERETGVGKDTLRVWERRYGFPCPERDANGDRGYPRWQIDRLRQIKRLLDIGYRPGKVVGASDEALQQLSSTANQGKPVATLGENQPDGAFELELLALRSHNSHGLRSLLSQRLARVGLERFVTEILPALNRHIGNAWSDGELAIFEEHLYTEQVKSLLRQAISSLPPGNRQPRVILTTVPGEQHALGILMVEALLVLRGIHVVSLGAQTPLHDIAAAAGAHRADIVALSFSAAFPARQLVPVVDQARALLPATTRLWIGGSGSHRYNEKIPGVEHLADFSDIDRLLGNDQSGAGS